tara:strand:- start:276 stop:833 length:558 start_codon:yes stop_codon:yes gene_type:complete
MKKINRLILLLAFSSTFLYSQENDLKKIRNFDIFPIVGQLSPFGENLRTVYNAGHTIGIGVNIPKNFTFLKKEWYLSTSIQYSELSHFNNNFKPYKMISIIPHIKTTFNDLILKIGLGFAKTSAQNLDKNFITGTVDIGYNIFKKNDFNIILNLHVKEILGSPDYQTAKGTSELYGINLEFSKGL